jgi:hypothetical protein
MGVGVKKMSCRHDAKLGGGDIQQCWRCGKRLRKRVINHKKGDVVKWVLYSKK